MSMLEWAGSSLQEEMLLRAEGLTAWPPSLNWDDTLLILEEMGSGRSAGGLTAMRWRQSSYRREEDGVRFALYWRKQYTKKNIMSTVNCCLCCYFTLLNAGCRVLFVFICVLLCCCIHMNYLTESRFSCKAKKYLLVQIWPGCSLQECRFKISDGDFFVLLLIQQASSVLLNNGKFQAFKTQWDLHTLR